MILTAPPSQGIAMYNMIHTWVNGATLVVPSPDFEAKAMLDGIEKMKCTHTSVVPTVVLALLKYSAFHSRRTKSLERVSLGGTIIPPNVLHAATDLDQLGATEALVTYGMTEARGLCASSSREGIKIDRGAVCVGRPLPGAKVRICHPESKNSAARGEIGEIHLGGDMLISGYLYGDNEPFYTDDAGRWMATGDRGKMDEQGKAGVLGHVVGIPDDIAGEVPVAVVEAPDQSRIPRAEIREIVLESLGSTCLPTTYPTLADLGLLSSPVISSGKIDKIGLRKAVLDYLSSEDLLPDPSTNSRTFSDTGKSPTLVGMLLAKLIGQQQDSIPRDRPLSTMLDSINILRLQANIQQRTGKNLPIENLLGDVTVSTLANTLDHVRSANVLPAESEGRNRPPAPADMVHAHDDPRSAEQTMAQARLLLAKIGLFWEDVDDVYPLLPLFRPSLNAERPLTQTMRAVYVILSFGPSLLRKALERSLQKWSILRSIAMKFNDTGLLVIVKLCKAMLQASIFELPDVESPGHLRRLRFPRSEDGNMHPTHGGPLARFLIVGVKDTGSSGLMMSVHHLTFDAISIQAFKRDLDLSICDESLSEPYTDYNLFADTYYQYSNSLPAQKDINFQERSHVDIDNGDAGLQGIRKVAKLDDLPELVSQHQLLASMVFKAACAIVNSQLSGSTEVIFPSMQAARQWPFLDPNIAKYLPNPVTIAGPTVGWAMNRIRIEANAKVSNLLTTLQEVQFLQTRHAHAPIQAVASQLNDADATNFRAAWRQLLNISPNAGGRAAEMQDDTLPMRLLQIEGHTDCMIDWSCTVSGTTTAAVKVRWDGAQFGKATVEKWVNMFMVALEWVAKVANWDKKLCELDLSAFVVDA
ncbi:MAG: hypothetical protein Q9181_003067 [Wetmoreana brouardii]